jgi:hypothetical protein
VITRAKGTNTKLKPILGALELLGSKFCQKSALGYLTGACGNSGRQQDHTRRGQHAQSSCGERWAQRLCSLLELSCPQRRDAGELLNDGRLGLVVVNKLHIIEDLGCGRRWGRWLLFGQPFIVKRGGPLMVAARRGRQPRLHNVCIHARSDGGGSSPDLSTSSQCFFILRTHQHGVLVGAGAAGASTTKRGTLPAPIWQPLARTAATEHR